jgi:phospholipid/cholesterol/gamma-HCH transport system substrate-binding protein
MGKKDDIRNARLGIFVLTGIVLALIAIFFIGGERNLFSRTFTIHAKFNNVAGLRAGNNVWLNGVKIGTVHDVQILRDTVVLVTMEIQEGKSHFINQDAEAFLGSEGLVGNTLVYINPGVSHQPINSGDTIQSKTLATTQDIINTLRDSGENLRSITNNLANITHNIEQGEGALGYLLTDNELPRELQLAIRNFRLTSQNSQEISRDIANMISHLQNNEEGIIYTLMHDTAFANVYENTMVNLNQTGGNLAESSQQLNELTERLQEGHNAIHVLTADEEFAANLQRTMRNAAEGSEKFEENMEALQHNFLFRGFFRRQERRRQREEQRQEDKRQAKEQHTTQDEVIRLTKQPKSK